MKKLYLIGNGYDLNNNLKTSFSDFKMFLKDNFKDKLNKIENTFNISDTKWSSIENDIANSANNIKALYTEVIDSMWGGNFDDYDHEKPHMEDSDRAYVIDEDLSLKIMLSDELDDIVIKWISQIKTSHLRNINFKNNYVVNFNYTDYIDGENILYVHGNIKMKNIAFGHFKKLKHGEMNKTNYGNTNMTDRYIYNSYNKYKWIDQYNKFIKNKYCEIIIMGLSLGDQDLEYIKKLPKNLPLKYYIYDNRESEVNRIKKILGDFKSLQILKWELYTNI